MRMAVVGAIVTAVLVCCYTLASVDRGSAFN